MDHPEVRNDGLHPRHPGRGSSTSLIACESVDGDPEVGGFVVFFPSGATKVVGWRQAKPIQPTLEASKQYATKVIETLQQDGLQHDIDCTNWASVTAAIQRIILDWNDGIQQRIGAAWAREFTDVDAAGKHLQGVTPRRVH